MGYLKSIRNLGFLCCVVLLVCVLPLEAYLDPGTGSYFFQIAIGLILGSLLAIKLFWGRIKAIIQRILAPNRNRIKDE